MRAAVPVLVWILALLGLACADETPVRVDAAPPEPAVPIAGRYEVEGYTADAGTGDNRRKISGTIILAEDGDEYTATFDLTTKYGGVGGEYSAQVIGKGEGAILGRELKGTASTQLVTSTVPGVDPGFAFIPRTTSVRILSTSVATIEPDGTAVMEIENIGAEGEVYTPTHTLLRGTRISAAGLGDAK